MFLESSNFYDITEIPFDKVGAFLVLMSVRRPASMERILCALKNLSAYLSNQYHAKSFANALVVKPAPRRKLMPVFSGDDISGIIAQAKQEKQLSLRDSAIYLLDPSARKAHTRSFPPRDYWCFIGSAMAGI